MFPKTVFVILLFTASAALAQVPPGVPYDGSKHPNPIVTFVTRADFKPATYSEATDEAGIELLGLSGSEGKRESLQVAPGGNRKVKIVGTTVDVMYYPVVQQTFKLTNGTDVVLHSFRFPKLNLPSNVIPVALAQAAAEKKKDPREMRFGTATGPEELDVRDAPALLFESEGATTVYWQEGALAHTLTASNLSRQELFRIIDDLL